MLKINKDSLKICGDSAGGNRGSIGSQELIQFFYSASKNVYQVPEYEKSFVSVYLLHSLKDDLECLRRAFWVAWNHPNLTEAVIWRPGGAQTLRTL